MPMQIEEERSHAHDERFFTQAAQIYRHKRHTPVMGTGHAGLMLVDNLGDAVIFSLTWQYDKLDMYPVLDKLRTVRAFTGRPAYVERFDVDAQTVQKIITGDYQTPTPNQGINTYINHDLRPIVHDLPYKEIGEQIYQKCCEFKNSPPIFFGLGNNCINFVQNLLAEQGIVTSYRFYPDQVHHAMENLYIDRISAIHPSLTPIIAPHQNKPIYYNRLPENANLHPKNKEI
jgi:hypothetical protein